MAQNDLHLIQNVHPTGLEFSEKQVNIAKGGLLSANASQVPTILPAGTNGFQLVRDDAEPTGLKWAAISGGHTQGTDIGTTSTTFDIDSDTTGVRLKNNAGELQLRNLADNAYADLRVKDLIVEGTTTTINATTLTVDDRNIELGSVNSPDDTTADGGGITLKGATDKTIIWDNANDNWSLNQNVNIPATFTYKINNTTVLSATQVLGVTLGTMASAAAADYVAKSLYDANTILIATADNTPAPLAMGPLTVVGRKETGDIVALSPAEIMNLIAVPAPLTKTSPGIAGQIAFDDNFFFRCSSTNVWKRCAMATNWPNS
ncbi:MAG TPA: hypothetical protein VLH16_02095 [Bacteroidales bacterium]|nr:hypothetical protein [Bacteroidales bacterium]